MNPFLETVDVEAHPGTYPSSGEIAIYDRKKMTFAY